MPAKPACYGATSMERLKTIILSIRTIAMAYAAARGRKKILVGGAVTPAVGLEALTVLEIVVVAGEVRLPLWVPIIMSRRWTIHCLDVIPLLFLFPVVVADVAAAFIRASMGVTSLPNPEKGRKTSFNQIKMHKMKTNNSRDFQILLYRHQCSM